MTSSNRRTFFNLACKYACLSLVVTLILSAFISGCTKIGDLTELTEGLDDLSKVASQSTRDLIGDEFAVRELARVAVVGRKEPVTVYEPIYWKEYDSRKEILDTFNRGLYLFYDGNFAEALDVFSTIRNFDAAGTAYAEKCQTLIASPPEDWQGVWVMTTK